MRAGMDVARATRFGAGIVMVVAGVLAAGPSAPLQVADRVVGGVQEYVVKPGDSLALVGARLGVDVRLIAAANGLAANARLTPGMALTIDNRHVVPAAAAEPAAIVINVPQRMLFRAVDDGLIAAPVAVGKPDWRTPLGAFHVVMKEENPTWDVPVSIQAEMRAAGKPVITRMPPGPENPLGRYWIGLSASSVGVHGTPAITSLYRLATHGCIRVHPEDIATLYPRVHPGDPVAIIYEDVLLAMTADGIFVEAHRDAYGRGRGDAEAAIRDAAAASGAADAIRWDAVADALRARDGVARRVG